MEVIALKKLVTKASSSLKLSDVNAKGKYIVYGASGPCGFLNDGKINQDFVAVVKDGAGIGQEVAA